MFRESPAPCRSCGSASAFARRGGGIRELEMFDPNVVTSAETRPNRSEPSGQSLGPGRPTPSIQKRPAPMDDAQSATVPKPSQGPSRCPLKSARSLGAVDHDLCPDSDAGSGPEYGSSEGPGTLMERQRGLYRDRPGSNLEAMHERPRQSSAGCGPLTT
jgi:hypothetical protein